VPQLVSSSSQCANQPRSLSPLLPPSIQHESHEAHVKYRWAKQDLAIWSNSVVNHLATFDFSEHRAGDRAVVVGETPYFDAESISRKQWLKASEGY